MAREMTRRDALRLVAGIALGATVAPNVALAYGRSHTAYRYRLTRRRRRGNWWYYKRQRQRVLKRGGRIVKTYKAVTIGDFWSLTNWGKTSAWRWHDFNE